jgi:hypothetical protein
MMIASYMIIIKEEMPVKEEEGIYKNRGRKEEEERLLYIR